jgi:hypothetical protein
MLENGFIVLHRKIVNWEWYKDPATRIVFEHLILTANYEEKRFKGEAIHRGQRVASYGTLAKETGLSVRNVRTAIRHLISTNEVTSKATNKYSVFTIVNYDMYQDKRQANRQTTDKQVTSNRQTTDNNETKITKITKINKEKQIYAAPAAHTNGRRTDNPGRTDF